MVIFTVCLFHLGIIMSLSKTVVLSFAFICIVGGMILAADYSQLELRVLAHLSKDQRLLQVSSIDTK